MTLPCAIGSLHPLLEARSVSSIVELLHGVSCRGGIIDGRLEAYEVHSIDEEGVSVSFDCQPLERTFMCFLVIDRGKPILLVLFGCKVLNLGAWMSHSGQEIVGISNVFRGWGWCFPWLRPTPSCVILVVPMILLEDYVNCGLPLSTQF